jgi:hypothetical protein
VEATVAVLSTSDMCAPHFVERVAGARGERALASEHGGEAGEAPGAAAGALPEEGKGRRGGAHLIASVGEQRATAMEWRAWATATEWTAMGDSDGDGVEGDGDGNGVATARRSLAAGDGALCGRGMFARTCISVGVALGKKTA